MQKLEPLELRFQDTELMLNDNTSCMKLSIEAPLSGGSVGQKKTHQNQTLIVMS